MYQWLKRSDWIDLNKLLNVIIVFYMFHKLHASLYYCCFLYVIKGSKILKPPSKGAAVFFLHLSLQWWMHLVFQRQTYPTPVGLYYTTPHKVRSQLQTRCFKHKCVTNEPLTVLVNKMTVALNRNETPDLAMGFYH